jgi:hypothetical protein
MQLRLGRRQELFAGGGAAKEKNMAGSYIPRPDAGFNVWFETLMREVVIQTPLGDLGPPRPPLNKSVWRREGRAR